MSLDCKAAIFMRFVMFCYPRFVYEKEMSLYSITVYGLQNAFITVQQMGTPLLADMYTIAYC